MSKQSQKNKLDVSDLSVRFVPLVVFIVGVAILGVLGYQLQTSQNNLIRSKAELNAVSYADRMKHDMRKGIMVTDMLEEILVSEDGKIDKFDQVAENMMTDFIQSIQLAPNGVVTEIYPAKGNEAGKIDLINDKNRGKISCYARDTGKITMQGPFPLKQGGQGIAIRNPVYLQNENGQKKFWGFTIVIIRVPEVFLDTIQPLANFGYEYRLAKSVSPWDEGFKTVFSSGKELQEPASYVFELGDSKWKLEVMPKEGWSSNENLYVVWGCGIMIILLLTGLITMMMLLRKARKTKNETVKLNQELQEALDLANIASVAKTSFLFNMSHDLRTPMNAILGYARMIKENPNDPLVPEYHKKLEESGNLLLSVINNVLDMARIESGRMELDEDYYKLGDVVAELCSVFEVEAKKKNITITVDNKVKHEHMIADGTKIKEIFTNLLSNAVKYTPEGGTVTIRCEELAAADPQCVRIKSQIIDNGIGMSKEYLPHMFDAFSRERNTTAGRVAGTGLGMPIVKKLVEMLGGTIEVASELGKGTRFTVILEHKIADKSYYDPKQAVAADKGRSVFAGKHVLMAEDNELNAEIAIFLLEKMGLRVERVEDGVQCVSRVQAQPAGTYDLVLMDIQMPNMDGYKATQAIRGLQDSAKANIPIVAMTANAFAEDKQNAFKAGMNGHIAKPIDAKKVEQVLAELLK